MELKYRISFFANVSIQILAILFFLLLVGASGHRVNFEITDYILFAQPVLIVILMVILKWLKFESNVVGTTVRIVLWILLLFSLYLALYLLVTLHKDKLDIGFLIFSHIVILAFCASTTLLLLGLIKKKI